MYVRFFRNQELMAQAAQLAKACGSEEDQQIAIFREVFAYLAEALGEERTKALITRLFPEENGNGVHEGDIQKGLAMGIVRAYLRHSRTVLTEEYLDDMCIMAVEFGYRLGRSR